MPVVVNATPSDPNANSYATLAEADAYHETILDTLAEAWTDADVDTRNRALVTATQLLDSHLEWIGYPATLTQSLGWPRHSAYTRVGGLLLSSEIPMEVKRATAELARRLIVEGMPDAASDTEGLKRLKAGPVEMEFTGDNSVQVLPSLVEAMVSHLISRSSSPLSVPVIRT